MNTLKEILVDAARYRGLRKMVDSGKYWLTRQDYAVAPTANMVDAEIDEVLARDN